MGDGHWGVHLIKRASPGSLLSELLFAFVITLAPNESGRSWTGRLPHSPLPVHVSVFISHSLHISIWTTNHMFVQMCAMRSDNALHDGRLYSISSSDLIAALLTAGSSSRFNSLLLCT